MTKKVLKFIWSAFTTLVIALEIVMVIFVVVMKTSGGEPNFFGYRMYVIVSKSMEPEIKVGDVIISKEYKGQELKVGDVVTYLGKEGDLKGRIVTHKVVEVSTDQTRIVTKGVANQIADPEITPTDIRAVMVKKTVVIGAIYSVITTTWGFISLVILPMVIMIGSEIVHLIRIMRSEGEDGEEEQTNN